MLIVVNVNLVVYLEYLVFDLVNKIRRYLLCIEFFIIRLNEYIKGVKISI